MNNATLESEKMPKLGDEEANHSNDNDNNNNTTTMMMVIMMMMFITMIREDKPDQHYVGVTEPP